MGSGAGGAGYSSPTDCDSLTCALIGSSRNLLSWIHCAGIGSSLQREHWHTSRQEERPRGRRPEAALLNTWRGKTERGGERKRKGSIPSSLPFCAAAAPPLAILLTMILFLPPFPYSCVSVAALKGRAPAAPWWFSLSASWSSTDETACPSCHCSAWLSCPLHYSYCSCSRPVTSTPPLLPKCSGEWALLFHHCALLDHLEQLRTLNLWPAFCFVLAYSRIDVFTYWLTIAFHVRKHE